MNKYAIILAAFAFSAESSTMFPDSTQIGGNFRLSIAQNVNGKSVGSNPQTGIFYGGWSSWETSSHMINCTPWTPDPSTVNWGVQFIQTNLCEAEETRHRDVTYYYADGSSVVDTEYEYVHTQVDDEQYAIGTKDYILRTDVSTTNWTNSGSAYSCTTWSPSESSYNLGVKFTQTRTCKQDQTRQKTYKDVWASGRTTHKGTTTETKTVSVNGSRQGTGTKQTTTTKWVTITSNFTNKTYKFNEITTITDDSGTTYSNAKIKEVKFHWEEIERFPPSTIKGSKHIYSTSSDFSQTMIAQSMQRCSGQNVYATAQGRVEKSSNTAVFRGDQDFVWRYDGCELEAFVIGRKIELKLEVQQ